MQKLHLVGFTADQQGLIFSPRRGSKSGGFVVPVNDELLDAVEAVRSGEAVGPIAEEDNRPPRQESSLSVREVQARLRVGRSINEVAREAGVDPAWVERFAVPVLAEQRRVIDEAHGIHLDKRGRGQSALPLGAAVRRNTAGKGVAVTDDEYADAWSAYQLHDSRWVVRFRYRSRGRDQEARWDFDQATGTITSQDRLGTSLGFVEAGEELAPAPPVRRTRARRRVAATTRTSRASAAKRAAKSTKKATKKATKAAAKKATAKKVTKKKAAPARKKAAPLKKKATPAKKAAPAKKASPAKKATKAAAKKKAARKATKGAARRRSPTVAVPAVVTSNGETNGNGHAAPSRAGRLRAR